MPKALHVIRQLWHFSVLQLRACAFAIAIFAGLSISTVIPLPIARYDALFLYALAVTFLFHRLGLETNTELWTTCMFHLTGLVFEIIKVRLGSWSYPDPGGLKVMEVPLFSGFMYAAVGSYVSRSWRLMHLRLTNVKPWLITLIAIAIYANFITHHWIIDLRLPLTIALLAATCRTWVHFSVDTTRYQMPLSLSFLLIGSFLWLAENMATFFRAWQYPNQAHGWTMVHVSKLGSWSLLVVVSIVQVMMLKPQSEIVA